MQNKDKDTLEFPDQSKTEASSDSRDLKAEGIIRTAFRFPVDTTDPVRLSIDGKEYQPLNISGRGAQITYSQADLFTPEQQLDALQLVIENEAIVLKGEVVYTTLIEPEQWACGIHFRIENDSDQGLLERFLEKKRKQIFSSED